MKFGKYIELHTQDKWKQHYIRYKYLKEKLKDVLEGSHGVYVPTRLALHLAPQNLISRDITAQESFFAAMELEIERISEFTTWAAQELRKRLTDLQSSIKAVDMSSAPDRTGVMEHAKDLGDEYLLLEKYVNINYAGIQKILKKHDKLFPSAPCWAFYKVHISNQTWVRGDHRDIQVTLGRIFTELHSHVGPSESPKRHARADTHEVMVQNLEEETRTFWVRREDVPRVENAIMQRMPVLVPSSDEGVDINVDVDDLSVHNTLFLDNTSLELYHNLLFGRPYATQVMLQWRGSGTPTTVQVMRKVHKEGWRPESSIKDSFPLKESRVAEFLHGRWTFDVARAYLISQAKAMIVQDEMPPTSKVLPGGASFTRPNSMIVAPGMAQAAAPLLRQDSHLIAVEYNLFKAFTEVQRLVETKQLQPMVSVRFRQTIFCSHLDRNRISGADEVSSSGNSEHLKIELDEDISAQLEYSYDGANRIENGVWRQEQFADRIECPYALVKVHSYKAAESQPMWLTELLGTGLLTEVHDFSKYLYGAAGLLPDMVRAVPVWIDDPLIQRALYINVLMRDFHAEGSEGDGGTTSDGGALSRSQSGRERASSGKPVSAALDAQGNLAGWQAKLIQRQTSMGRVYKPQPALFFKETNKFYGTERIFLTWLTLSITVASVAVVMLGFAATAAIDPDEVPTIYISEATALLLMACAIFICAYSIVAFLRRSDELVKLYPNRYDDTGGAAVLYLVLVLALFTLFCLNIADLIEVLQEDDDDGRGPPHRHHPKHYSPPSFPSPPPFSSLPPLPGHHHHSQPDDEVSPQLTFLLKGISSILRRDTEDA